MTEGTSDGTVDRPAEARDRDIGPRADPPEPDPVPPDPQEEPPSDPEEQHGVRSIDRSVRYISVHVDARRIDKRSGGVYFHGGSPSVGGSVVGRDSLEGGESGPPPPEVTREVDCEVLKELTAVYVEPPMFGAAIKILLDKRIVLLRGRAGWGKVATGLRLLSQAKAATIAWVDPALAPEALHGLKPAERHGYLIDTLAPGSAEKLDSFQLERMGDRLRTTKSLLVITVDSRVAVSRSVLGDYMVECETQPDRELVLRRHLARHRVDVASAARLEALLSSDQARQLYEAEPFRNFYTLASEMVAVASGKKPPEALSAYGESSAREQVQSWFEKHTDPRDATLMLTVAVLNGARYQDVADSARDLYERVVPPDETTRIAEARGSFTVTRERRVQEVCARLERAPGMADSGASTEVVKLDNPDFQFEVLNYVWQQFDDARGPLLEWLSSLGGHPDETIRYMAAGAVGGVMLDDFEYALRRVVLPWACHRDWRRRLSAAVALGVPAQLPETSGVVLELLQQWTGHDGAERVADDNRLSDRELNLLWTAAVAYSRPVGEHFHEAALNGLHAVAARARFRLFWTVDACLVNLFEVGADKPELHQAVLGTLLAWADESKRNSVTRLIARQAFVDIGGTSTTTVDGGTECPTLLWLLRGGGTGQREILELWRRVLGLQRYRRKGFDLLDRWLAQADGAGAQLSYLEGFLRRLVLHWPRIEQDIRLWLRQRAEHPRVPSTAAWTLYRAL